MRYQNGESGHCIDGERLGEGSGERGSEEGDTTLGFAIRWEEGAFISIVIRKERRCTKCSLTARSVYLVVEEALHVIDGQQMFTIHGNDDRIPELGHENLNKE